MPKKLVLKDGCKKIDCCKNCPMRQEDGWNGELCSATGDRLQYDTNVLYIDCPLPDWEEPEQWKNEEDEPIFEKLVWIYHPKFLYPICVSVHNYEPKSSFATVGDYRKFTNSFCIIEVDECVWWTEALDPFGKIKPFPPISKEMRNVNNE